VASEIAETESKRTKKQIDAPDLWFSDIPNPLCKLHEIANEGSFGFAKSNKSCFPGDEPNEKKSRMSLLK
jgi:hypothetical protein